MTAPTITCASCHREKPAPPNPRKLYPEYAMDFGICLDCAGLDNTDPFDLFLPGFLAPCRNYRGCRTRVPHNDSSPAVCGNCEDHEDPGPSYRRKRKRKKPAADPPGLESEITDALALLDKPLYSDRERSLWTDGFRAARRVDPVADAPAIISDRDILVWNDGFRRGGNVARS